MLMNAIIVVFSLLMLGYWFRYACLLLLNTKLPKDHSNPVWAVHQLQVFEIQNRLASTANVEQLDELKRLLDRDYQLIMYLIRHGANFKTTGHDLRQRILILNYQLLKLLYGFSKLSDSPSRKHLQEMVNVIAYFATILGERSAVAPAL
jgi:hypothetical protein